MLKQLVILIAAVVTAGTIAQFALLDGLMGVIAPVFFETDTAYAPAYTDANFRRISVGLSSMQVTELLGEPIIAALDYSTVAKSCGVVWLQSGRVKNTSQSAGCPLANPSIGMSKTDLIGARGPSAEERWIYATSPTDRSYRERIIVLVSGTVTERISRFYVD